MTTSHVIVSTAAAAAQQAQQQRTSSMTAQPMTTGSCANMVDGSMMSIDHQLHHQIQKQLCIDQFELLSQLQVFVLSF